MRLFHAALILLIVAAHATAAPPSFPYRAYVTSDGVYVRSGPGDNYYPTAQLEEGVEVEVHRHDPGGWYAIRPPAGSFTWVSSRYLRPERDGLASVIGSRVAARVGSQLSDHRDVVQVRLNQGELVEILETKTIEGDPESTTWYKIAPPAGEFRWVFGKYLDPEYPHDGIRKVQPGTSPLVPAGPPASDYSPGTVRIPTEASSPSASADSPSSSPGTAPALGASAMPAAPSSQVTREERVIAVPAGSATDAAGYAQRFVEVQPGEPEPPSIRRMSPEEFQRELEDVNLALSVMLVEEPAVWNCHDLAIRAESLVAQAETALERGRARLLLNRVQHARDIKDRHQTLLATKVSSERNSQRLLPSGAAAAETAPNDGRQTVAGRFDGMGRLARVVPASLGAPQYALKDDKGQVQCYVTPAPGVNMQYYVGRRIGISGIRGSLPEQNLPHVTAKHITALEQPVLR